MSRRPKQVSLFFEAAHFMSSEVIDFHIKKIVLLLASLWPRLRNFQTFRIANTAWTVLLGFAPQFLSSTQAAHVSHENYAEEQIQNTHSHSHSNCN